MSDNIISINDTSNGFNEIECTFHNGVVSIAVDNPWAGSTDTGFGYTCYVSLSVEKAHELGRWLLSRNVEIIREPTP